ncbi:MULTISPECIES: transglycosylase SLT domain-containing protein [Methylococcus]|uniref:Transglycosylase SLT domain-containing protein n=1 Tax=Methylococcus capsulatus TaxID=414 RepID=A0ABZ2F407_METCP|nr:MULTISPECIES: transglycosylase SLT domain-containing protein [Methylococcus]
MKRFPFRPRLLATMSLVVLLLPGCANKPNNLKPSVPEPRLGAASENPGKPKKGKQASPGSQYDTLWERMFSLYALPQVEHRLVDREVSWFINHPDYLKRAQKRAEPFLYTIVRQLEKQKMPGELALLPIVESAFQPHAVSPARAAGIWQFIPETGRRYGLKRSRSYDGRRDVYASTRAAIKYLKKLHNDFNGDWLLAIAAYNCGEGAVAKAIQRNEARNLPTDFWSLDLPEETKAYVPRLLAVSKVFANADKYAIDLHYIPNEAIFKPVKVSSQLDLALAADAADMSLERMLELNPGFKHPRADIEGSYRLFVPADKSRKFKKELARLAMSGQFESHLPADETEGSPGTGRRSSPDTVMLDAADPARDRSGRKSAASAYTAEIAVPSRYPEWGSAKDWNRRERWQSAEMGSQAGVIAHLRDGSRPQNVLGVGHEAKTRKGKRGLDDGLGPSRQGNPGRKNDIRNVAAESALSREEASHDERTARTKEKYTVSR